MNAGIYPGPTSAVAEYWDLKPGHERWAALYREIIEHGELGGNPHIALRDVVARAELQPDKRIVFVGRVLMLDSIQLLAGVRNPRERHKRCCVEKDKLIARHRDRAAEYKALQEERLERFARDRAKVLAQGAQQAPDSPTMVSNDDPQAVREAEDRAANDTNSASDQDSQRTKVDEAASDEEIPKGSSVADSPSG